MITQDARQAQLTNMCKHCKHPIRRGYVRHLFQDSVLTLPPLKNAFIFAVWEEEEPINVRKVRRKRMTTRVKNGSSRYSYRFKMRGHANTARQNTPSLIVRGRFQDWLHCWVVGVVGGGSVAVVVVVVEWCCCCIRITTTSTYKYDDDDVVVSSCSCQTLTNTTIS